MEQNKEERVDLSRLNRRQRRAHGKAMGMKIPGRNLPYVKAVHGSWKEYNKLRDEEIKREQE